MKRTFLIVHFLAFLQAVAWSQDVRFEIQAGLSSPIRKIVELDKGRSVCIATQQGDLLVWDVSGNKTAGRLHLETEIYDMIYLSLEKQLIVSTPDEIYFFYVEDGILDEFERIPLDNPTALYVQDGQLYVATQTGIRRFSLDRSFPEANGMLPAGNLTAYALRVFNDKIITAGNAGMTVFSMNDFDDGREGPGGMDSSSLIEEPAPDQEQAEFTDQLLQFNTGWYAHWWDVENRRLYASREGSLLVFDHSGDRLATNVIALPIERENNVTGLRGSVNNILVGTRDGSLFRLDLPGHTLSSPLTRLKSASVTTVSSLAGLDVIGDYYGNVTIFEPVALEPLIALNDGSVASINGVYLDDSSRMVTTHKDPSGAHLRVWDIRKASLLQHFRVFTQQIIAVEFAGDSIKSFHADGAEYAFVRSGSNAYDSVRLKAPLVDYAPGWGMSLPDADPMLVIQQDRQELREAALLPGRYEWSSGPAGTRVMYSVAPNAGGCESMPPYEVVQKALRESGLLAYMTGWDVLDQDLFYMKACRYSEERFREYLKGVNLPLELSMAFFQNFRSPALSKLAAIGPGGDTIFAIKKNGLQYIRYHPAQQNWFLLYDSSAVIIHPQTRKQREIAVRVPDGFFHYAYNGRQLAITTAGKTVLYQLGPDSYETSWLSFGENDFLVFDRRGYFRARGRSTRILGFEDGEEKPLAYFDLKYNRPDILIQNLEGRQSAEAAAFSQAIGKRLKRYQGRIPVWAPRADISPELLPLYTKQARITLGNPVRNAIIWVNGVKETMPDPSVIRLTPGLNRIEIRMGNERGDTIFFHREHYVYSASALSRHSFYFGAGINAYADTAISLKYATTDIRDLEDLFEKNVKDIRTFTLYNEEVTTDAFAGWRKLLAQTGLNDVVMMSLSGHGYLDSTGRFQFASPASTSGQFLPVISYDSLVALLDATPARRKILFIDACHSGLLDDESTARTLPQGVVARSFSRRNTGGSTTAFRLMQEEFQDLTRHNGTIVIAAAAGSEYAIESTSHRNGLFTHVLKKGLFEREADANRDGRVTTSELQQYLGREVEILSGGGQKPSTNQDNQGIDWPLLVPGD